MPVQGSITRHSDNGTRSPKRCVVARLSRQDEDMPPPRQSKHRKNKFGAIPARQDEQFLGIGGRQVCPPARSKANGRRRKRSNGLPKLKRLSPSDHAAAPRATSVRRQGGSAPSSTGRARLVAPSRQVAGRPAAVAPNDCMRAADRNTLSAERDSRISPRLVRVGRLAVAVRAVASH
ncbi:hypothetical protein IscW_ISCW022882 [Ixodes scapularis]|uniref:Uncharacterized protein n=1 Tax=Ixodes scapularis TaxID=6945 RepID=B7QD55_IXOSC|nr:hypothetical protein IscW_ISCW022882 [Ixodes scapularis]|eukprot:XP_002413469.1 hypothetical protein IscW_ISCW022882 [Ixodes scapularis]